MKIARPVSGARSVRRVAGWAFLALVTSAVCRAETPVDGGRGTAPRSGQIAKPDHGPLHPVRSEEFVPLNGLKQYLLIRGDDVERNPVLLFVHGGPGFPGGIFARKNAELERDFTVVHWDQRGAGHSYRSDLAQAVMRVDQFVDDTVALSRWLANRFGQRKIFVVGHSWGTMVAALAAARAPECFYAFVSVSQLANYRESQRVVAAQPAPPPVPPRVADPRLFWWTLSSPEYSPGTLPRVLAGYRFTVKMLETEITATNLFFRIKALNVPIWFFAGAYDNVVGEPVIRAFYDRLRAPRGKHYVRFERSRHWPHLQEPEKFASQMRLVRQATWEGAEVPRRKAPTRGD